MRVANHLSSRSRFRTATPARRAVRKDSNKFKRIKRGTTVVAAKTDGPTMLLSRPRMGAGGVGIRPGTALKVVDYKAGFHQLETMGLEKTRGWVPMDVDTELKPQLSVPRGDRKYLEFDKIDVPAFNGPVKVDDINQGYLGDCYLVGAMAALAFSNPGAIRNAIRKGDEPGSYVVTLYRVADNGRNYGKREIKVDAWYPTKDDHLLYAQGGKRAHQRYKIETFETGERPLWPAIIEKAFATMLGGYDQLDKGGMEATVFEAITGNDPDEYDVGRFGADDNKAALDELKRALRKGLPVAVSSKCHKVLPNIYDTHVYIAVGYSKNRIILRNPHDTRQTMALSYEDFSRAFETFCVASPWRRGQIDAS